MVVGKQEVGEGETSADALLQIPFTLSLAFIRAVTTAEAIKAEANFDRSNPYTYDWYRQFLHPDYPMATDMLSQYGEAVQAGLRLPTNEELIVLINEVTKNKVWTDPLKKICNVTSAKNPFSAELVTTLIQNDLLHMVNNAIHSVPQDPEKKIQHLRTILSVLIDPLIVISVTTQRDYIELIVERLSNFQRAFVQLELESFAESTFFIELRKYLLTNPSLEHTSLRALCIQYWYSSDEIRKVLIDLGKFMDSDNKRMLFTAAAYGIVRLRDKKLALELVEFTHSQLLHSNVNNLIEKLQAEPLIDILIKNNVITYEEIIAWGAHKTKGTSALEELDKQFLDNTHNYLVYVALLFLREIQHSGLELLPEIIIYSDQKPRVHNDGGIPYVNWLSLFANPEFEDLRVKLAQRLKTLVEALIQSGFHYDYSAGLNPQILVKFLPNLEEIPLEERHAAVMDLSNWSIHFTLMIRQFANVQISPELEAKVRASREVALQQAVLANTTEVIQ